MIHVRRDRKSVWTRSDMGEGRPLLRRRQRGIFILYSVC
jgi:hypothetical protein